ncbi:hypothetical protein, partial [Achromobacter denitrificans]|uniref:hypothetical protein n=1 Tax=Achromobacter denitrificans TaxID=32002 RepID=UPI000964EE0B
ALANATTDTTVKAARPPKAGETSTPAVARASADLAGPLDRIAQQARQIRQLRERVERAPPAP